MIWKKQTPLIQQGTFNQETWIRQKDEEKPVNFPMDLYLGKKTNLLTLKKDIVASLKKNVAHYQETRTKLYLPENTVPVPSCPVTGIATEETTPVATVYGAEYVQTPDTGHVYVSKRPNNTAINNFYLSNVSYAATYTNRKGAEFRLNAIAVPWLEWTKKVYFKQYGRYPKKILDVGSGAGHFVQACRQDGIEAHGIELSESSRKFSREVWDIELDGRDFLEVADEYAGYDIVTFWGLLEHTPNPGAILQAAQKVVGTHNEGMVISKIPRWHCLGSAAQRLSPNTIIRHIDPMGHIMLFSDASAAELYYLNGFNPTAAWYYGMDVYEMLTQIGHLTDNYVALTNSGEFQVELQQFVDEARFADGLTLVGVPSQK